MGFRLFEERNTRAARFDPLRGRDTIAAISGGKRFRRLAEGLGGLAVSWEAIGRIEMFW